MADSKLSTKNVLIGLVGSVAVIAGGWYLLNGSYGCPHSREKEEECEEEIMPLLPPEAVKVGPKGARMERASSERRGSFQTNLSSRQKKMKDLPQSMFERIYTKDNEEGKEGKEENKTDKFAIDTVKVLKLDNLRDYIPNLKWHPNIYHRSRCFTNTDDHRRYSFASSGMNKCTQSRKGRIYGSFTPDRDIVLFDIVRGKKTKNKAMAFRRAGAREKVCFNGSDVNAAIITCGGLCPGLNVVIVEVVEVLYYAYGVDNIFGIQGGYRGLTGEKPDFIKLNPDSIEGINRDGGTILFSSRGGLSPTSTEEEIGEVFNVLEKKGINMLFIIGGDGTHRGAYRLYEYGRKYKKTLVIAGVPKTIDNDMGVIDSSFGFNTAVEEATKAIFSAVTEATCNKPNGVGVVKLMGRHAGYIACHATLASRQVDMCLINEDPFLERNGPDAVGEYILRTLQNKGHAVLVVAEGAGSEFLKRLSEEKEEKKDAGGNVALKNPCDFLISHLKGYFKKMGEPITIKFIDPSYMIRSVPANASDNVMCVVLAQNAVHGAMAGYTGFTSGIVNNRSVMIPMPVIMTTSPSFLNPRGRTWSRVLAATQQPVTLGLHSKP